MKIGNIMHIMSANKSIHKSHKLDSNELDMYVYVIIHM